MAGVEQNPREPRDNDPDALTKALELELILKRAAWQRAAARGGRWRALSFLFLFLVIAGGLLAYFYFVPMLSRQRAETPAVEATDPGR